MFRFVVALLLVPEVVRCMTYVSVSPGVTNFECLTSSASGLFKDYCGSLDLIPSCYTDIVVGSNFPFDDVDLVASPASCQQFCQKSNDCVRFMWHPESSSCKLLTLEDVEGALTSLSDDGDICDEKVFKMCSDNPDKCETCGGNTVCAWKDPNVVSGPRFCNPISADSICNIVKHAAASRHHPEKRRHLDETPVVHHAPDGSHNPVISREVAMKRAQSFGSNNHAKVNHSIMYGDVEFNASSTSDYHHLKKQLNLPHRLLENLTVVPNNLLRSGEGMSSLNTPSPLLHLSPDHMKNYKPRPKSSDLPVSLPPALSNALQQTIPAVSTEVPPEEEPAAGLQGAMAPAPSSDSGVLVVAPNYTEPEYLVSNDGNRVYVALNSAYQSLNGSAMAYDPLVIRGSPGNYSVDNGITYRPRTDLMKAADVKWPSATDGGKCGCKHKKCGCKHKKCGCKHKKCGCKHKKCGCKHKKCGCKSGAVSSAGFSPRQDEFMLLALREKPSKLILEIDP